VGRRRRPLPTSFKNKTITTTKREIKMKKTLLALLSAVLLITVTQPAQAEDQKVLAIIDSAINSANFNSIIHEVCFTTVKSSNPSSNMSCPNGELFMEGPGAASAPWPKNINSGTYHGDAMVKAAIVTNPNIKIVFIRFHDVTVSGNSRGDTKALALAIDWVSKNSAKYSIDAVSISQSGTSKNHIDACTGTGTFKNEGVLAINAVSLLSASNIPTFVATGNDQRNDLVGFPSCVPGVIGVGALATENLLEMSTNTGPGLDLVALTKVSVTKYNGFKTDIYGTSTATVVASSSYVKNNTYKTFQEYSNSLKKVSLSQMIRVNNKLESVNRGIYSTN
jgi:hypothetical protein